VNSRKRTIRSNSYTVRLTSSRIRFNKTKSRLAKFRIRNLKRPAVSKTSCRSCRALLKMTRRNCIIILSSWPSIRCLKRHSKVSSKSSNRCPNCKKSRKYASSKKRYRLTSLRNSIEWIRKNLGFVNYLKMTRKNGSSSKRKNCKSLRKSTRSL